MLYISDPRPEYSDADFRQWLSLLDEIGTGRGLPRKPPKPKTVSDEWSYLKSELEPAVAIIPGMTLVHDWRLSPRPFLKGGVVRAYETHRGEVVDENGYVLPNQDGAEIVISAYRDREAARIQIEARYRRFVPGYRFPVDRFRTFSTEPYFPDATDMYRVGRDATRWNDYRL